ncbi:hypothetical protein [Flexithrix dorotheae]|uniref:hypothetical protein n=1 Tax=Flexithrix dorotheae TaxID=70993 RepID=UPI000368E302|nr:hypothetical protein [Flexithrix dorotheae]
MKKITILFAFLSISTFSHAQTFDIQNSFIRSFKPDFSNELKYIDLDKDGDPDLIYSSLSDSIPLIWIDDDDDMKNGDLEGDMDNDCLIIDRNRDGVYAGPGDLSLDWVDHDGDGAADMQVIVENKESGTTNFWEWSSNYMWIVDEENDDTFHYINWKDLVLKAWSHYGASNFYEDYHGQTLFQKAHIQSYRYDDLRYSWENPFLFYDIDKDGLSEIAIRLEDSGKFKEEKSLDSTQVDAYPTAMIDHVYMGFDLDNDNGPSNEFDFDMSLYFSGEGFSYADQKHQFKNMRGLPAADSLFFDSRWRKMDELIYAGHDAAWDLVYNKGNWEQAWMTFDEDDDCERWERVEFYQPKDPFIIGMNKGGIDNNPQADASGDRGEWDLDNSGKGNLYIGFDGKIHLFGAEKGYWRIDQDAWSYQGWGGLYEDGYVRSQKIPEKFPTIAYDDTNGDGFFNQIRYDLDGDTIFEQTFNLEEFNINTEYEVINTGKMQPEDLNDIFEKSANQTWEQAQLAMKAAAKAGINYKWYAQYMYPKSLNEKYRFGYWLQFYIFSDFMNLAENKSSIDQNTIVKAYFGQNWKLLID